MRGLGQAAAAQAAAEAAATLARRVQAEKIAAAHVIALQKAQAIASRTRMLREKKLAALHRAFEEARWANLSPSSPQAAMAARDRMVAAQGALNAMWNTVPPSGPSVGLLGLGGYYRG